MARLVMWNLVTLDGCFEGVKPWDLDWHERFWGPELEELSLAQLRSAGALVFGRVTYQGMAAYWSSAEGEIADHMNRLPKVVFSRTLTTAEWNHTRLVRGDAGEEMRRLKLEVQGDLFLFGSADLASTFIRHDLIDEYRLGLVPILLGKGTPLFKADPDRKHLRLLEARTLPSGCVILRYEPEPGRGRKS